MSSSESLEILPTTSRILTSPAGSRSTTPVPPLANHEGTPHSEASNDDKDAECSTRGQAAKHNHPLSLYNTTNNRPGWNGEPPSPSHSHHSSLPPLPVNNPADSTQSLGGQLFVADGLSTKETIQTLGTKESSNTLKNSIFDPAAIPGAIPPPQLPDDLRICLEVIENNLLEGHVRLSKELKRRYEEQYPLVRSLAYVFIGSVRYFVFIY